MSLLEYIPPWVIIAFVAHGLVLGTVAYLILLERKVASWVQDRLGPNRVGPKGLFQPLADGLKFLVKEDYRPGTVDKYLFTLAPAIMIAVVIITIAVIPWAGIYGTASTYDVTAGHQAGQPLVAAVEAQLPRHHVMLTEPTVTALSDDRWGATVVHGWYFQIAQLDIGLLFIVAALSLAVYGVVLGGWSSNNKYSFLGALRATAQMISYEIPLGLSIITIVVMFGTLELGAIVEQQSHYWLGFIPAWNVFIQPLPFLMFLVCIHAEANRAPFDVAEAEQELVGGYHTEYSSMRFALFFLAEYAGMITTAAICTALFFGGWHFPGLGGRVVEGNASITDSVIVLALRVLVFSAKTVLILFVFMWVRWSLPRFRFDQLMVLAWRAMIPISIGLLIMTAGLIYLYGDKRATMFVDGQLGLMLLVGNVALLVITMLASLVIPPPPATNRRIEVPESRFKRTPLPAS